MSLETLKAAIIYAMKENLNIQFVYPSYELPSGYQEVINSIDHTDIKPAGMGVEAEVVVFEGWKQVIGCSYKQGVSYVVRTDRQSLYSHVDTLCALLNTVERLNVVLTDIEEFAEEDFHSYANVLHALAIEVEKLYVAGKSIQLNLLTDRMMLDKMNNCGAGDTTITLAPDGKFYVCPAFYLTNEEDVIGKLNGSVGDLSQGLEVKNPQLYKLDMRHFVVVVMRINVSVVFG